MHFSREGVSLACMIIPPASGQPDLLNARAGKMTGLEWTGATNGTIRSITPLVFSSTHGAGPAATVFLKRLAAMVAVKKDRTYRDAVTWLCCRLPFVLLLAWIVCLCGSRLGDGSKPIEPTADLAESRMQVWTTRQLTHKVTIGMLSLFVFLRMSGAVFLGTICLDICVCCTCKLLCALLFCVLVTIMIIMTIKNFIGGSKRKSSPKTAATISYKTGPFL